MIHDPIVVEVYQNGSWSSAGMGALAKHLSGLLDAGSVPTSALAKVLAKGIYTRPKTSAWQITADVPVALRLGFHLLATSTCKAHFYRARKGRRLIGSGTLVTKTRQSLNGAMLVNTLAQALTDASSCMALGSSPTHFGVVAVPHDPTLAWHTPAHAAALAAIGSIFANAEVIPPKRTSPAHHIGGYWLVPNSTPLLHVRSLAWFAQARVVLPEKV